MANDYDIKERKRPHSYHISENLFVEWLRHWHHVGINLVGIIMSKIPNRNVFQRIFLSVSSFWFCIGLFFSSFFLKFYSRLKNRNVKRVQKNDLQMRNKTIKKVSFEWSSYSECVWNGNEQMNGIDIKNSTEPYKTINMKNLFLIN